MPSSISADLNHHQSLSKTTYYYHHITSTKITFNDDLSEFFDNFNGPGVTAQVVGGLIHQEYKGLDNVIVMGTAETSGKSFLAHDQMWSAYN